MRKSSFLMVLVVLCAGCGSTSATQKNATAFAQPSIVADGPVTRVIEPAPPKSLPPRDYSANEAMRLAVSAPSPQLSNVMQSHFAGEELQRQYHICVGADGKVTDAKSVDDVPIIDDQVLWQLNQWIFAPQRTPFCFTKRVYFDVDRAQDIPVAD